MTARALVLAVLAVLATGLTACGSSSGGAAKVGAPPGPTVLRLAAPTSDISYWKNVQAFIDALHSRSKGRIYVRLIPEYGAFKADAEPQIVRGVAQGDVDLGYVRTSVMDNFGVTSLRALTAPMLITSYGAQAAVLRSELPRALLPGVRKARVTGLALLADGLERPFAAAGPLLGPDDYRGRVVAAYPSRSSAAALRAVGATTTSVWNQELFDAMTDGTVDGYERTLRLYASDPGYARVAPNATANVVLWPQILVLFANPATLQALPAQQRRWIEQAAADATKAAIPLLDREPPVIARACANGARFSLATPEQISALRSAFAPVLAALERDAEAQASLARIRSLIAGVPDDRALAVPAGCAGKAPEQRRLRVGAGRVGPLDGTYRWVNTFEDKRHQPNFDPAHPPPDDTSIFTLRLAREKWKLRVTGSGGPGEQNYAGTFRVDGDRITFQWEVGGLGLNVYRFRRTDDGLRLTGVSGDPDDEVVWTSNPWHRVE